MSESLTSEEFDLVRQAIKNQTDDERSLALQKRCQVCCARQMREVDHRAAIRSAALGGFGEIPSRRRREGVG